MNPLVMSYISLGIAIACEVAGTTLLQKSEQFTKILPTAGMLICYCVSLYFLSLALKSMPVGIAYAIWGGLGIVLISAIGCFLFKQSLDWAAITGVTFIVLGVVIVNVFSKSISH